MNSIAPVILFVYNRPDHTIRTLSALEKNKLADQTTLYIYSDAAKNEKSVQAVTEVRKIINEFWNFKEVIIVERTENWGLAANVIDGVTKVVNAHGKIIVLEDDLETAARFPRQRLSARYPLRSAAITPYFSGFLFYTSHPVAAW